jgi:hypothetical protein
MRCPKKASVRCTGTVTIQTPVRTLAIVQGKPLARVLTLGRGSFRINKGASERVLVDLTRRARSMIYRLGRLRATVIVQVRDAKSLRTKFSREIVLKAPKSAKK